MNIRAGKLRAALEHIARDTRCKWARQMAYDALEEDVDIKERESKNTKPEILDVGNGY